MQVAENYFKTLHELPADNIHDLIDTQWAVLHRQVVQVAMTHLKEGPDLAIGIANQMVKGPTLATMAAGAVENMLAQGDLCLKEVPRADFFLHPCIIVTISCLVQKKRSTCSNARHG